MVEESDKWRESWLCLFYLFSVLEWAIKCYSNAGSHFYSQLQDGNVGSLLNLTTHGVGRPMGLAGLGGPWGWAALCRGTVSTWLRRNFSVDEDMNWLERNSTFSIDAVAKANVVANSVTFKTIVFPELKISPCPTISRSQLHQGLPLYQQHLKQRANNRNDVLYSTTCHGGRPRVTQTSSRPSNCRPDSQVMAEKEADFQRHVKKGISQSYSLPILPKEFTTDFVTSWVTHGSDRQGLNNCMFVSDDCK